MSVTIKKIAFERQDLRRLWLALGAIELLDNASLSAISKMLDMQMSTLQKVIDRLNSDQLPGLVISVSDGIYSVTSWGVIDRQAVIEYTQNNIN